jgi:hypothetical protein
LAEPELLSCRPFFAVGDRQVAALFVATTVASALV